MQKEELNNVIPSGVLKTKNKAKSFNYGYDDKYDIIVISKDGTVGKIFNINGLKIALPSTPKNI